MSEKSGGNIITRKKLHDEGVDTEGGVSHDVEEASSGCGCAWLCQDNLQEDSLDSFYNLLEDSHT